MHAAGITDSFYSGATSVPSAETVARGRQTAAAFALTPDEERLNFSVYFALRTFFEAARAIPGNQHVLEQVIRKPSVWSVVKHFGVDITFSYAWEDAGRRRHPRHVCRASDGDRSAPVHTHAVGRSRRAIRFVARTARGACPSRYTSPMAPASSLAVSSFGRRRVPREAHH